MGVEEKTLY